MSKSIGKVRDFSWDNHERWELEDEKFRPAKLLKKFDKLLTNIDPAQLASRFLNSFMPQMAKPVVGTGLAVSPVTTNDITVTAFQSEAFAPPAQVGFITTANAWLNLEIGFDLTGTAYQSLINGMLASAKVSPNTLPIDPISGQPISQIDTSHTYHVEFGLSALISTTITPRGTSIDYGWLGAIQVFDKITGQASMGYGWSAQGQTDAVVLNQRQIAGLILGSAASPTIANSLPGRSVVTFFQPAYTSTPNNIPQQEVASLYVQNVLYQTPTLGWPPSLSASKPFDPIPSQAAFVPVTL